SESWMQTQQEMFRNATRGWVSPWPGLSGPTDARKRWTDLTVEILNRHRESLDAFYKSLIQLVEQSSRISEAKSSEEARRATEELWGQWLETFKNQSESRMRDAQTFTEKSLEIVQNAQA
ncbi:MAG TPA: hypothetical protein VKZ18_29600, partial [Polyangia bacterium]|nr:hypothetical protein [Polyangia bacterium]